MHFVVGILITAGLVGTAFTVALYMVRWERHLAEREVEASRRLLEPSRKSPAVRTPGTSQV